MAEVIADIIAFYLDWESWQHVEIKRKLHHGAQSGRLLLMSNTGESVALTKQYVAIECENPLAREAVKLNVSATSLPCHLMEIRPDGEAPK